MKKGVMMRSARFAVEVLSAAVVLSAAPVWAQTATPEEVQNPLLVLQHLPYAPSRFEVVAPARPLASILQSPVAR